MATTRRPRKKTKPRRDSEVSGRVARPTFKPRRALEVQTLQLFRTIFGSARRHDAEIRRLVGIPGAQIWALSEIAREEAISVNTLSERMALHQTTASNLVNALVERKLIRRVRDSVDQRVVRLHILADGKQLLLQAPGPYAGLLPDALNDLNAEQLKQLIVSLSVLVKVLKRTSAEAAGEPLLGL